jgi:hypothetical protein
MKKSLENVEKRVRSIIAASKNNTRSYPEHREHQILLLML